MTGNPKKTVVAEVTVIVYPIIIIIFLIIFHNLLLSCAIFPTEVVMKIGIYYNQIYNIIVNIFYSHV